MTFAEKVIDFYQQLKINKPLPNGVEVLNPYLNRETFEVSKKFYLKYYRDNRSRTLIFGINPGRFGGGTTGIPFTDPIKLETECHIKNNLPKKPELSADYIYYMIRHYGGPKKFYKKFYFSAVSPLGFTKNGKNLNYYDIKELKESLSDFIFESLKKQLFFGVNREVCYCLGEGENFKFFSKFNSQHKFFDEVVPLAHPRFIMQYRRKKIDEFVEDYLRKLKAST
jgi:hypothetical protein